jgi:[ribosomal protein S5]-alanine N-acetyltransferase
MRLHFYSDIFELSKVILETERLRLEPISLDYLTIIYKNFSPEISRYMYPRSPEDISETKNFIEDSIKKLHTNQDLVMVILDKSSEEFLGVVGLHSNATANTPELGVWLKKEAHGNKYGQEALKKLKDWTFENIIFDYLIYPVVEENIASRKIAELLGGKIYEEYRLTRSVLLDRHVYIESECLASKSIGLQYPREE